MNARLLAKLSPLSLLLLAACGGGGGGSSSSSNPPPPPPPPPNLYGIAFGNSQWVSVGAGGSVFTSPFSFSGWATQTSHVTADLRSIAYGGGKWVAVGDAGTIIASSDGANWTADASGTSQNFRSVAYGNNTWVAVGWNGALETSPDGVTWTARTSGTANNLQGIAYGNNGWNGAFHAQWVAVGQGDTVLLSSDTITWSLENTGTGNDLFGVGYNPNIGIAVTSPPGPTDTYYSGVFEVVGASGTFVRSSLSKFSGVQQGWTSENSSTGNRLSRVAAFQNGAVAQMGAVGDSGTIVIRSYGSASQNGLYQVANGNYFLSDLAWYNGTWMTVGASKVTFKSTDGYTWTQVN